MDLMQSNVSNVVDGNSEIRRSFAPHSDGSFESDGRRLKEMLANFGEIVYIVFPNSTIY